MEDEVVVVAADVQANISNGGWIEVAQIPLSKVARALIELITVHGHRGTSVLRLLSECICTVLRKEPQIPMIIS